MRLEASVEVESGSEFLRHIVLTRPMGVEVGSGFLLLRASTIRPLRPPILLSIRMRPQKMKMNSGSGHHSNFQIKWSEFVVELLIPTEMIEMTDRTEMEAHKLTRPWPRVHKIFRSMVALGRGQEGFPEESQLAYRSMVVLNRTSSRCPIFSIS